MPGPSEVIGRNEQTHTQIVGRVNLPAIDGNRTIGNDQAELAADDAFYVEDERERVERFASLGCLNIDMESSVVLNLCLLRGVRAAFIAAVSENLVADVGYLEANEALNIGIQNEIRIVLETIVLGHKKFTQ